MSTRDDPNSLERLASDIDQVEVELVRMQSKLWSVRRRIQERLGKKIGFQYEDGDDKLGPLGRPGATR